MPDLLLLIRAIMYSREDELAQEQLVLFRNGEEKGFTFVFNHYYPSLYFFCFRLVNNKLLSEDIVQESFIKVWQRRNSFMNIISIKSYLYKIVSNAAIDHIRHQKFITFSTKQLNYLSKDETDNFINDQLITTEVITEIYTAINALPFQCRKVFTLFYLDGKDLQRIADELNLSINTVKSQKARGLSILRKRFSSV